MNEDDEEELEALEAADALMNPSVEQEAAEMARIKQRAKEHGVNPKSHGEHGWAGSIMRKSERFLERHGERLQYDKAKVLQVYNNRPFWSKVVRALQG